MAAEGAKGFLGGILRSAASGLASSFINSLNAPSDATATPHIVQEVTGRSNIDDVSHYHIFKRDKFSIVLLHGRNDPGAFSSPTSPWIIVLHQPGSQRMWYLYRSSDQTEAIRTFDAYKSLALIVKSEVNICDAANLQKICSKLREPRSEGWTAAHIAAYFDYPNCFNNQLFKEYLNQQEGPMLLTPLHVAVESNNMESVRALLKVGVHMDVKDIKENNIVHIASKSATEVLTLVLEKLPVSLCRFLNDQNCDGLTPLAIACSVNLPQNVEVLLGAGCDVSVRTRTQGYPLTIALKNDCALSTHILLRHSSDQINLQDDTDGSCSLHLARSSETLQILLDNGGDPNIQNNNGETPLHIQAKNENLKGALALLCRNAFPNMKDQQGDTPLHVAARACSAPILQVLMAFDADLDLENNLSQTARHLVTTSQERNHDVALFYLDSCGAKRCRENFQAHCTEGCKFNGLYKGIAPEKYVGVLDPTMVHHALEAFSTSREVLSRSRRSSFSDSGRQSDFGVKNKSSASGSAVRETLLGAHVGGRLLCLDGGGIRGLVLTQILIYMQREFGVPIVEVFDWISGTSTGGIMALCLASGKSPIEIQGLYLRLKDKVFVGERPYSSETMEEFLKQEFGRETKMCHLKRPRLMITTAIANQRPADFHFFRNYLSPSVILGESDCCTRGPEDLYVWEVAKATGAAPSYFRLDAKYIDGGLVANNPTLDALTEMVQFGAVMKANGETNEVDAKLPSVVVSLGTGVQPRIQANYAQYDISRPAGVWDAIVKVPKIANIIALLVEQATQTEGQVVERARAWCSSIGVPFFRFSPNLSQLVDLDEIKEEVLVNVMWETRAYLHAHHGSLVHLKALLFANGSPPPQ